MTVLVPFDGSPLSSAALEKARSFASLTDAALVAITVIPDDDEYARERGWITRGEPFDTEAIDAGMRERVDAIAPEAEFYSQVVDSDEPTATATTNVVRTIRQAASDVDASVIVVGTENAGSVTTPLSSVGGPLSSDQHYDVYLVRHAEGGGFETN
ncbi:universal stress protein [Natronobiforma cellulositropha]|uniref:universal stress protein n=1 Tax=Natronobiforma cellulositropha TaxID=1679076 RepID=UPI0021D608DD|nr:universal stress protein [Natronobiforma cellulositropha]